MRGMLLQIAIERHRLLYHLMMQLRGVEQMQAILFPHSKAQMGYIEA